MNKSENIDKLVEALALAQAGLSSIGRNRKVRVKSKRTDTTYEFEYTTFDAIIEHVRTALTANGLWFTQTLANESGKYRLVTTLLHKSGQWIASETPIMAEDGGNQAFGSALTYMKRYALAAMLGIASDDDDDANEADGNTVQDRNDRRPSAPPPRTASPTPKAEGAKSTAGEWATNQSTVIRTLSMTQIGAWERKNEATMRRLEKADPRAHAALEALLTDRRNELRNFGIAAE